MGKRAVGVRAIGLENQEAIEPVDEIASTHESQHAREPACKRASR